MDFICDPRYGWLSECQERFGRVPAQILHEWNSATHVAEFEGQPGRRPLTYDEVQALFDAADGMAEDKRAQGRKGALTAMRNAALLKAFYAWGLRRQEMTGLDLADLRRNPKLPDFGRYGAVFVRYGKSSNGSPPKRRTVFTVPEMDWLPGVLDQYVTEVRPRLGAGQHPALWVTERCGRLSRRGANDAFEAARDAAGLPAELDLHSLRHSMITHLVEFGYPERYRPGSGRPCRRVHDRDLHRRVGRVPEPAAEGNADRAVSRAVGGFQAVNKKMGIRWNLRKLMADRGMFQTTDLVPKLADRGIHLSREQVFRLVTQTPQRLSTDALAALCDILECTPNDLIEVEVVNAEIHKTAGEAGGQAPAVRRTSIRRPEGL